MDREPAAIGQPRPKGPMLDFLSSLDIFMDNRRILASGARVVFSGHAYKEMDKDGLAEIDCINVLRAGTVSPAEFENGCWRYRVQGGWIWVVVAFRSEHEMVVITAWRQKR